MVMEFGQAVRPSLLERVKRTFELVKRGRMYNRKSSKIMVDARSHTMMVLLSMKWF